MFSSLIQLSLESCLVRPNQLFELLHDDKRFASLRQLQLSDNNLTEVHTDIGMGLPRLVSVNLLDISNNKFRNLSCFASFTAIFPALTSISLQANCIKSIGDLPKDMCIFPQIHTLNLSQNSISSFTFIDELPKHFPNLKSLHITQNPFFTTDHATASADPKATDKKYYLTLARLASLQSLNYTKISARDREEGEIYYLSVADDAIKGYVESAKDRKTAIEQAKISFPRYEDLARKYGNNSLAEKFLSDKTADVEKSPRTASEIAYPAGSLGARIVTATFYMADTNPNVSATIKLPSTVPATRVMALLTQHISFKDCIRPLRFRLIYESNELDPVDTTTDSTTRSATYGRKLTLEQKRALWQEWGDWDADAMLRISPSEDARSPSSEDHQSHDEGEHWIEEGKICIKDGRRFKHREVEIPPALKRPWGDWLDDSKEVRIRIEPYKRS